MQGFRGSCTASRSEEHTSRCVVHGKWSRRLGDAHKIIRTLPHSGHRVCDAQDDPRLPYHRWTEGGTTGGEHRGAERHSLGRANKVSRELSPVRSGLPSHILREYGTRTVN